MVPARTEKRETALMTIAEMMTRLDAGAVLTLIGAGRWLLRNDDGDLAVDGDVVDQLLEARWLSRSPDESYVINSAGREWLNPIRLD
jgi:hypothetical protein